MTLNIATFKSFLWKNNSVTPEEVLVIRTCSLCVEPGAMKRKCCNALYCDHCYTKNQKCPNCETLTKQEKLTGATFQMKVFSEHEECRICLDPGLKRRCCNNYYCDECYYKVPNCRSCGLPVGHSSENKHDIFLTDRAELFSVVLGWMITVFFVVCSTAFLIFVIYAEVKTPVGIFDYKCYGFLRKCGFHVCVDLDKSVADGKSAIPAISDWSKCTVDSVAKLESPACIYDHQLYAQSNKLMGYDVCRDEFNNGVYIFEDTFEYWGNTSYKSNKMASATWKEVVNGNANENCGAGRYFGGRNAMTFQGPLNRFAMTNDLDVSPGGKVEAEMFLPPIGYDAFNQFCKTGYIGVVNVDFSTTQGNNWTTMASYDPALWRQPEFFSFSLDIPAEARTNSTRFRFIQPVFQVALDNWAIDNVRILRNLPENWHQSSLFQRNLRRGLDYIQRAQCCVDTDWCDHRLTEEETKLCAVEFPLWFVGQKYLIRLSEVLMCAVVLITILKSLYAALSDGFINSRVPFQEEILELFEYDLFSNLWKRYMPLRYRYMSLLTQNDFVHNIHTSARMEEKLRDQYNDEEGQGDLMKRKEVIEKEKKVAAKKIRKAQKKLQTRMKNKNFQTSTITVAELSNQDDMFDEIPDLEAKEGDAADDLMAVDLASKQDKDRRQNVAMLRIPFTVEVDETFRALFTYITLSVFAILFFFLLGYSKYYAIYEPLTVYGQYPTNLELTSILVVFFAAFCDFKEIYYALRNVVPARNRWLPQVTIDLSEEVRCLFVGDSIIPVAEIKEVQAFPPEFMRYCLVGYSLGVFPWCLFSILLREAYLDYASMRVVTPMLGTIMILRAILGPSFAIKSFFSFKYLLDVHYRVRENMGIAFQQDNTLNSAVNTALICTVVGIIIVGAFALDYVPYVVAAGIVGGAVYGAFTGCIHNLPIKPWIYLTSLRGGVWMTVKKRQSCPCVYWGKYCTPMHSFEEMLVVYTTDDLKFVGLINGGINTLHSSG